MTKHPPTYRASRPLELSGSHIEIQLEQNPSGEFVYGVTIYYPDRRLPLRVGEFATKEQALKYAGFTDEEKST